MRLPRFLESDKESDQFRRYRSRTLPKYHSKLCSLRNSSHPPLMSPTSATAASPPQKEGSSASTASFLSLSWLEALPTGTHVVIGSFLHAADVCRLSLASRWCLETFVEEEVSVVTLNSGRDIGVLEGPVAHFLAAYLRRRRRLKCVRVSLNLDCHTVVPLALASAVGSCRQVERLH